MLSKPKTSRSMVSSQALMKTSNTLYAHKTNGVVLGLDENKEHALCTLEASFGNFGFGPAVYSTGNYTDGRFVLIPKMVVWRSMVQNKKCQSRMSTLWSHPVL